MENAPRYFIIDDATIIYDADGVDLVAGLVRGRDGDVTKAWVHPTADGKGLDIRVWTTAVGSGAHGRIEWLRFDGKAFQEIVIPDPAPALLEGHMGHDRFDIVDGALHWEFPVYRPADPNSRPTGGRRRLVLPEGDSSWDLDSEDRGFVQSCIPPRHPYRWGRSDEQHARSLRLSGGGDHARLSKGGE